MVEREVQLQKDFSEDFDISEKECLLNQQEAKDAKRVQSDDLEGAFPKKKDQNATPERLNATPERLNQLRQTEELPVPRRVLQSPERERQTERTSYSWYWVHQLRTLFPRGMINRHET